MRSPWKEGGKAGREGTRKEERKGGSEGEMKDLEFAVSPPRSWLLPMIVLEPRPPVGGLEQGLESAREVHEAVAHEEEHGEQRRDFVNVSCKPRDISHSVDADEIFTK